MRDRLIELFKGFSYECHRPCDKLTKDSCNKCAYEQFADYLLANGVIVPPCKVGDTVYVVSRYYGGLWQIHECRVDSVTIYEKHIFMKLVDRKYDFGMEISEIGKTVFLTREEAEQAIKRLEQTKDFF